MASSPVASVSLTIAPLRRRSAAGSKAGGGKMVLSGIDPRLYRVFKITHLKDLFEFYENSQAAIQSLK